MRSSLSRVKARKEARRKAEEAKYLSDLAEARNSHASTRLEAQRRTQQEVGKVVCNGVVKFFFSFLFFSFSFRIFAYVFFGNHIYGITRTVPAKHGGLHSGRKRPQPRQAVRRRWADVER